VLRRSNESNVGWTHNIPSSPHRGCGGFEHVPSKQGHKASDRYSRASKGNIRNIPANFGFSKGNIGHFPSLMLRLVFVSFAGMLPLLPL